MDDGPHAVTCLRRRDVLRPREDECVLDAAWRADVPLASSCGGQAVCGDCVVRIVHGAENALPPDDVECAWFARRERPPGVRLACRLRVRGPVTIATTYW